MGFWETILETMGGDDQQVFGIDEDFNSEKAEDNWNSRSSEDEED